MEEENSEEIEWDDDENTIKRPSKNQVHEDDEGEEEVADKVGELKEGSEEEEEDVGLTRRKKNNLKSSSQSQVS